MQAKTQEFGLLKSLRTMTAVLGEPSAWYIQVDDSVPHTTFKLMVFSQDECCKHWAVWISVLYDPSSCGFGLVVTLTDYLFLFLFMYLSLIHI